MIFAGRFRFVSFLFFLRVGHRRVPSQIRLLDAKQTQQKSKEEIEVIRLQCISESVSFVLSRGVGDVRRENGRLGVRCITLFPSGIRESALFANRSHRRVRLADGKELAATSPKAADDYAIPEHR